MQSQVLRYIRFFIFGCWGILLLLIGWGIFLSNALAFLVLPGFVLYMNRFQIEPEERALTRLFGQAFVTYRSQVRRWI